MMQALKKHRAACHGFTLLDTIFTVVVLGILAKFAMMKVLLPATVNLPAQAQSVSDTVRRAQSLAVVRGQRVRVTATSGANFSVAIAPCDSAGTCTTDSSLTVLAGTGVMLCTTNTVYFNSLGEPVVSAAPAAALATSSTSIPMAYTAACPASAPLTVTVAPLTGRVSVGP